MKHYDTVVIGAGLAGLQCALRMANAGLSVALVDGKRDLTRSVHTTGIFVRRTFEEFEFPAGCLGPAVRHVTLYSPARRPLVLESPRAEFRVGRMAFLYEQLLDHCRNIGVDIRLATRFLSSEPSGYGSRVSLDARGDRLGLETRFLVGADGARSRVAGDLGLSRNRRFLVGAEDVFHDVPLDGPPRFDCFLDPALAPGYIAWVVHDGRETHVGVAGESKRFDALRSLERFRASLAGIINLQGRTPLERRGGRIPVGGVLPRIVNTRGLLVGDAAGAVSPLTAGGLDPCYRLSHLAAEVARDYLDTGRERVLKRYSGNHFRTKFRLRRLMRWGMSLCRSRGMLEAACWCIRRPLFRRIAEHVFFGRGSFPDVPVASDATDWAGATRNATLE